MAEVEIKAKVTDFSALIAKLTELGCQLSEPITQIDKNYIREGLEYKYVNRDHTPVLRLREEKDRTLFTIKYNRYTNKSLDNIEKEVTVSDAREMEDMIKIMGFYEVMEIRKVRRKGKYKEYEICLDEVESLGSFIEVEKLTDEEGTKVEAELVTFLNSLDVNPKDRVLDGYDFLLLNATN